MRRYRFVCAVVLAVLLLAVASPALAFDGGRPDGKVVWGEDFTLPAGDSVDGDLVVLAMSSWKKTAASRGASSSGAATWRWPVRSRAMWRSLAATSPCWKRQ